MGIVLFVILILITYLPVFLVPRNKLKYFFLCFFFSWTIIGWFILMFEATTGENGDLRELNKRKKRMKINEDLSLLKELREKDKREF